MKRYRVPVLAAFAATLAAACGSDGGADTVAKVGSQELTVTQLSEIMSTSQAPLETDVARSIAELWVNYQLAGVAAARGDSVMTADEMDTGLWMAVDNMRVKTLYDEVSKTWVPDTSVSPRVRYDAGELLSARHILVQVAQDAEPAAVEAARKKADGIRSDVTPANFARLASRTEEPGGGERGGDLGVFAKGAMVADFENALLAIRPGEISPVVRTSFGFHVIYRKPYAEVAGEVATQANQRGMVVAESLYLANMEQAASVKLKEDAVSLVKDVARNPLGFRTSNAAVAEFKGGTLTAARIADRVAAFPPEAQVRPQLIAAPDSIITKFIEQIVRDELLLKMADSAGIAADTAELSNLRMAFRNNLTVAWTTLGVEPASLSDSAKTPSERETLVGNRINAYFRKLVKNEVQFADVAYPVARALQSKYEFSINDVGLERAMEAAKALRAAADSAPTVVPGISSPLPADSGTTPPPSN